MSSLVHSLLAVFYFAGLTLSATAAEAPAPITRIADIRRLSREDATKALPVRISGVCVWSGFGDFIIHDGEQGLWVGVGAARERRLFSQKPDQRDIKPGTGLEIEGITDPGGFAPVVIPKFIRKTGTLPMPEARRLSLDRLISGSEDGQRVEVEGVLQRTFPPKKSGDWSSAIIMIHGHYCWLWATRGDALDATRLVDARIRVRGVIAPEYNARSEVVMNKIFLMNSSDIDVITPPPPDSFASPRVPLSRLMTFSPDAMPGHRKVTSGTVTFAVPGEFFFLQDGATSVRIPTESRDVKVGQRVDVAGFLDSTQMLTTLRYAIVHPTGSSSVPIPQKVTLDTLLGADDGTRWGTPSSHDLSGRAVNLRAQLRRIEWKGVRIPETVWIDLEGRTFPAHLPLDVQLTEKQAASWVPGAEIDLTGICELEFRDKFEFREKVEPGNAYQPTGFHLWLASPEDLHILRHPPWWTPARLYLALGGVALALLLVLTWTWTLGRRVKTQTAIIGEQIQKVAVHEERSRIARDMHDEIGSQLARLSMLGQLVLAKAEIAPKDLPRLQQLTRGVRETAGELEQVIWSVDPKHDTHAGLAHRIFQYAEEYFSDTQVVCRFEPLPEIPNQAMPPQARAAVLAAVKETLANVLKHSGAAAVTIGINIDETTLQCRIQDAGFGFDSSAVSETSGNGLANIRQRLIRIGGSCEIESKSGHGTTVILRWPLFFAEKANR